MLFIGNLLWIFGTSYLYLNDFSRSEAARLSSMSRYLGTFLLVLYLVAVTLILRRIIIKDWKNARIAAIVCCLILLPNPAPLVSEEYFATHRGHALLDPADTDYDRNYAELTGRYARLIPYAGGSDLVVLQYGHGNLHWLLFTLAPTDCCRAESPEGLIDRVKGYPDRTYYMYIDADADVEKLCASALLLSAEGEIKRNALYSIAFAEDDAGFSVKLIESF